MKSVLFFSFFFICRKGVNKSLDMMMTFFIC